MSMKKYLQLFESLSLEEMEQGSEVNSVSCYEIDTAFSVEHTAESHEDHTSMYHVVGNNSDHTYASFGDKDAADFRAEGMNKQRKQELEEDLTYEDEFSDDEAELDFGSESNGDLDSELDSEIALSAEPEMEPGMGLDIEPEAIEDYSVGEPEDMGGKDLTFNYTATIQIHGYDYPLVVQSDYIDDFKTVMRVLRQSGLSPEGDYKWNSKTFNLDDDSAEDQTGLE